MELYASPEVYEKVIHYDEDRELQVRLTISTLKKNGALLLME